MLRYDLGRGVGVLALALMTISCGGGERLAAPTAATPAPPAATIAPRPTNTEMARPTAQPAPAATATAPSVLAPQPVQPTPRPLTELDQAVRAAQADLAQRLGIAAQSIQVAEATEVEWPNLALGCPEPGMMYGQVIVPGFRVVLKVGSQQYDYHGDRKGTMKLCQNGQPVAGPTQAPDRGAAGGGGGTVDPKLADQVALAKADLQGRLKTLKEEDIRVLMAVEMTWNDGSLGCPEPGMMYTQALVPGYRIVLESGGVQYDYHGAKTGKPRLCQPSTGRLRGPIDLSPQPPPDPSK
ncbi:MAG: hypothetical protein KIT87_07075 [Anaerolineae bacterium]|nr:hypothetical protein [Anaerolineae bacterium]